MTRHGDESLVAQMFMLLNKNTFLVLASQVMAYIVMYLWPFLVLASAVPSAPNSLLFDLQRTRLLRCRSASSNVFHESQLLRNISMAYIARADVVMACIIMAYIVMACILMACIVTAYLVMVYIVMAYTVMACIVMAYIIMAYIVMAYIVMAYIANVNFHFYLKD